VPSIHIFRVVDPLLGDSSHIRQSPVSVERLVSFTEKLNKSTAPEGTIAHLEASGLITDKVELVKLQFVKTYFNAFFACNIGAIKA